MCKLNYFNQIPAAYMQHIELIMNPFILEERAYSISHQITMNWKSAMQFSVKYLKIVCFVICSYVPIHDEGCCMAAETFGSL